MNVILGVLSESALLLNKMSIYLLFGFLIAGFLHVFLKRDWIARHLGKGNFSSVLKAALFGIPLPLCSCGVLPTALSLKKDGASKGAVLSFLISTPMIGVASILPTYALLGGVFVFFRVLAAFITAVVAGVIANIFIPPAAPESKTGTGPDCHACRQGERLAPEPRLSLKQKVKAALAFAFGDLLDDTSSWLVAGLLIGGAISYSIPPDFIDRYLGSAWLSMSLMLLVGIPMYVCSSGSIPVAAVLMMKGLDPGAAFVFLMTGPATNSVALTVIAQQMGKASAAIFLGSIIVCSFVFGFGINAFLQPLHHHGGGLHAMGHESSIFSPALEGVASFILMGCILLNIFQRQKRVRS